jgi:hypothetical protein
MRVEVEGKMWRADTEDDWAELLGMKNAKVFHRALKPLVDRGIVVKLIARFNGVRCLHLRLSGCPQVGIDSEGGYPEVGIGGYPQVGIPSNNSYLQQIQETSSGDEVGSKLKEMANKTGMPGTPDPKSEIVPEVKSKKAIEITKHDKAFDPTKAPEEHFHKNPTSSTMHKVWVAAHVVAYGGAISTQPWNVAELKLVNSQLIARVDDKDVLQRAFAHAVESWDAFTEYARKRTEWFKPPEQPSIVMLCKYPAVMCDFYRGNKKGTGAKGAPDKMFE